MASSPRHRDPAHIHGPLRHHHGPFRAHLALLAGAVLLGLLTWGVGGAWSSPWSPGRVALYVTLGAFALAALVRLAVRDGRRFEPDAPSPEAL